MQNNLESNDRGKSPGQRKTFLRMSRRNLFFQLPGNRLCTEDFVSEMIDETAQGACNGQSLFVANGEVNLSAVHGIVPVNPAKVSQSAQSGRKAQALNLFRKGSALSSGFLSDALQARPKQCACSAWRKVNDGLCLAKDCNSAFRHVLGRDDPAFNRINGLSVDFKNIAIAMDALPETKRRCVVAVSRTEKAVNPAMRANS